ncbi:hypothetical protein AYK61_25815 [Rhodococcus sp. SBT000017]|nr:hypothetical protein AYK61_25815 [Rhodococcus sp. SBT000017]
MTADGDPVTEAVIDGAAGHWAVWLSKEDQFTLTATGEVIEEDSIDWDTEDDPEAIPDEGVAPPQGHHRRRGMGAGSTTRRPDDAGVKPGPISRPRWPNPQRMSIPPMPRPSPR